MTAARALVLLVLLQQPRRPRYIAEICQQTRCGIGSVSKITTTLAGAGWICRFTTTDHHQTTRTYALLTIDGVQRAREALRQAYGNEPSQIVVLARCGAACWPGGDTDNPILRWCPACFPGKQDLLDQRNRDTPANRFVGLGPDAYVGAVPDLADLRCPPLEPAASPAGATRGEAGGTGRRVGRFTPIQPPADPGQRREVTVP